MEHSPLPWRVASPAILKHKNGYVVGNGYELQENDASFIKKCVNNHYLLITALNTALRAANPHSYMKDSEKVTVINECLSILNKAQS